MKNDCHLLVLLALLLRLSHNLIRRFSVEVLYISCRLHTMTVLLFGEMTFLYHSTEMAVYEK
jgi:hypothetical protein